MRILRQATAADVPIGPFLDSLDGTSCETSLTITQPAVRLKKNAANWAQKAAAQTLAYEENGFYEVTLDATDTDTVGLLRCAVFATGACPVWEDFMVVEEAVYDALYAAAAPGFAAANRVELIQLGDLGDLDGLLPIDIKFLTLLDKVPTTLVGTPLISIYKDNSTTQWTTTIAPTVDFDGLTGLHNASVDPLADGAFFSQGSNFQGIFTAGTVGGVAVAPRLAFSFSIRARAALLPTEAGRMLDVTALGTAGIDLANVENPGATLALSGTTIKTATDVEVDTSDLQTRVPAALVGGRMSSTLDTVPSEPAAVFAWGGSTFEDVLAWLGVRASNTQTQTATTTTVRNRANDCDIATSASCDTGGVVTRGSFV